MFHPMFVSLGLNCLLLFTYLLSLDPGSFAEQHLPSKTSDPSFASSNKQEIPSSPLANGVLPTTNRTVFGHLHYAKTAGTEINGMLAAKYERVCGHKGYSYDYYQYNQRIEKPARYFKRFNINKFMVNDVVAKVYPKGYNRGRVHPKLMDEIGYENCDYISLERPWNKWQQTFSDPNKWPSGLELHVPCREPLAHLMSQCAERRHTFDCQATDLSAEINKCLVEPNRFDMQLEPEHNPESNLLLKCFDPIPVDRYLDYMEKFLQPRRLPANHIHRFTSLVRNKTHDCVWGNDDIADRVQQLMVQNHPYYRWCHDCLLDPNRNLLVAGQKKDKLQT